MARSVGRTLERQGNAASNSHGSSEPARAAQEVDGGKGRGSGRTQGAGKRMGTDSESREHANRHVSRSAQSGFPAASNPRQPHSITTQSFLPVCLALSPLLPSLPCLSPRSSFGRGGMRTEVVHSVGCHLLRLKEFVWMDIAMAEHAGNPHHHSHRVPRNTRHFNFPRGNRREPTQEIALKITPSEHGTECSFSALRAPADLNSRVFSQTGALSAC